MAYTEDLKNETYEANADLSAAQYKFVKEIADSGGTALSPSVRVNVCDAAGEAAIGVLQNKPKAQGHAATVGRSGTTKVKSGAAVGRGEGVTTDAQGRAIPATVGQAVLGVARIAASGADQIISVELLLSGRPNAA